MVLEGGDGDGEWSRFKGWEEVVEGDKSTISGRAGFKSLVLQDCLLLS